MKFKTYTAICLVLIISLMFSACGKTEDVDPHEGEVLVNDGFNDVWIEPIESLDANPLQEEDFVTVDDNEIEDVRYVGNFYSVKKGIDVFSHQYDIDWTAVHDSGIDFAIIQIGYRGYTEGGLFEDDYFKINYENARANGIEVGVYFFSQAMSVTEAIEEAEFVLGILDGRELDLPVYFDWESEDGYRTYGLEYEFVNECAVAFCESIKLSGYDTGIYFSKQQGYYCYDLERMSDYSFWVVDPGDFMDFYYEGDIWQYSLDSARVPGIETAVDLNMMFIKPEVVS